jgi:hypothetical protein
MSGKRMENLGRTDEPLVGASKRGYVHEVRAGTLTKVKPPAVEPIIRVNIRPMG